MEDVSVKRLVSVLLFFAVTFLIFHDQMTLAHSSENAINKTCHSVYEMCPDIDLHEQLHAYTISFDSDSIVFTDFPQLFIITMPNQDYEFITFNPPYRPPSA